MAFNELELRRIKNTVGEMCHRRTPPHLRNEVELTYEVKGYDVTVYEIRSKWNNPKEKTRLEVARFKLVRSRNEWRLYWMRQDLKWHRYEVDGENTGLEDLVKVVDEDEYGAFFG